MKRGVLLTGVWLLGVAVSVSVAFAAVGRVADRVAPANVARLSQGAVDRALSSTTSSPARPHRTDSGHSSSTTTRSTTTRPPSSVGPRSSSTSTPTAASSGPSVSSPPPVSSAPTTSPQPPHSTTTTPSPTTTPPSKTVTTSQGGTVWTRCSGANQIVYVAAVPTTGYERVKDVEGPGGIQQWFENDSHLSKISAHCSDGRVEAEVEEERTGDAQPGAPAGDVLD